jgi:hypothetical protein
MKKYLFYLSILSVLFLYSCQDEEILLSKPGEAIDPVTDLDYSIVDDKVNLKWKLPSSFPDDIIQPVSVHIRISSNGQNAGTEVIEGDPASFTFSPYDTSKEYKFTVKVMADVDTENPHESDLRYSLGNTIKL